MGYVGCSQDFTCFPLSSISYKALGLNILIIHIVQGKHTNTDGTFWAYACISSKSTLTASLKTIIIGKMDSQLVNNLVHILLMHFVDSSTMLFRASHIGFSSGIVLLSVCFICSLTQVRYAVIRNYPYCIYTWPRILNA